MAPKQQQGPAAGGGGGGGASSSPSSPASASSSWTAEQHRQLWQLLGGFVVFSLLVRLVFETLLVLYVMAPPLLYIYLVSTCPGPETFDAKRQLKRVLRGDHLPPDHPGRPRGVLGEAVARVQAAVVTEIATLPGYEVTLTGLLGAVNVACVRVPTANLDFYWAGALNSWYYVCATEITSSSSSKNE
jgi:hypothetical protein